MRRAGILIVLIACAALIAVLASRGGSGTYTFAAVFDDARGMVTGQQVKIAGAVVGTVKAVDLASGPRALMVLSIERRFAPFHADATCTILPEGLISENFVECNPGRSHGALPEAADGLPTVPLNQTTVPFSLQDVLNVFLSPTDQQLGLLISELGIATAGRGEDLNALLGRANPALGQVQRVLSIIDAQRAQIGDAVIQTDEVLGTLARRSQQVREFVDRASTVARTTASVRVPLAQSVQRLPAMLAAIRPGLASLNKAATNASPLLDDLRAAAPGVTELTHTLPAFSRAGLPALRTLESASAAGIPAVRSATPVVSHLLAVSGPLRTLATGLDELLVSTRNTGGFEGIERVAYALATVASLYDNVSHIFTPTVSVIPACIVGQQAGINVAGCPHKYSAPGQGALPVNEPSCGPKDGAWFNETCPAVAPGPIGLARTTGKAAQKVIELNQMAGKILLGKPAPTQALRSVLEYLIK